MAEEKREKAASEGVKPGRASRTSKANPDQPKRIYRSKTDRMIGGVCGGVAKYLNVDPVIIRIAWALAFFAGGTGVVAYIVGWIIIPEDPNEEEAPKKKETKTDSSMIWGLALIMIGGLLLVNYMDWFSFFPYWNWSLWGFPDFDAGMILPILLIGVGIFYIFSLSKKDRETSEIQTERSKGGSFMEKRLTRSVNEKMIAGVCGGIAKYFNVDPSIVRIVWAILTFANPILGVLLYIIMMVVVPDETAVESTSGSKASTSKAKAK